METMTVSNKKRCEHGPGICLNIECVELCPCNPRAWDAMKKIIHERKR